MLTRAFHPSAPKPLEGANSRSFFVSTAGTSRRPLLNLCTYAVLSVMCSSLCCLLTRNRGADNPGTRQRGFHCSRLFVHELRKAREGILTQRAGLRTKVLASAWSISLLISLLQRLVSGTVWKTTGVEDMGQAGSFQLHLPPRKERAHAEALVCQLLHPKPQSPGSSTSIWLGLRVPTSGVKLGLQ